MKAKSVLLGLSFLVALLGVSATSATVVQAQEAKWTVTVTYNEYYAQGSGGLAVNGSNRKKTYVIYAATSSEAEARGEAKCIQEVGSSGAYIAKIVSVSADRN